MRLGVRIVAPVTGLLAACAPGPSGPASAGASLVLHGGALYVASADDDAVVVVDPTSLDELGRFDAPSEPERLVVVGERLLVTALRDTAVGWLDPADGSTRRVELPCGGTRGVATDGVTAWVSCPYDGRVVALDGSTGELLEVLEVGGRPSALAWSGGRLLLTDSAAPEVRALPGGEIVATLQVEHQVSQFDALVADGEALFGVAQDVENDGDRDRPPEQGGYGSVVDGDPRIEPRLLGPCGGRYAAFVGRDRVFSGPSALAWDAAGQRLWVVHRGTRNVAVLDCSAPPADGLTPLLTAARTGQGARGITLSEDGRIAWVDDAFDAAITRIELDAAGQATAVSRRREVAALHLSAEALEGRKLFHDALDVQLTPSGIVSCATCHPDGGEDGLVWFLHTETVPRKLRRTPPAWGVDPALRPLHWDGAFAEPSLLVRETIRGLMGGQGLLVDADAVSAWMGERSRPVPRPVEDEARVQRGAELAERHCTSCHVDGGTDGLPHDVLDASPDPDAALDAAITPSLAAVRARAPYLHDGRSPTLEAVLVDDDPAARHGGVATLTPSEREALLAWLESR